MKNVCIVFNGGSYGTFIEWCLNYFSDLTFAESLPFTDTGNSHNFNGVHKLNFQGIINFVESDNNIPIVRFHPKTQISEDIMYNLSYINTHFNKIIYLMSGVDTVAWNINNKFEKIWPEGWLQHNKTEYLENLSKWQGTTLDQMQLWEKREFISLYSYLQHLSESELEKYPQIQEEFNKFYFIDISELRDNFKETILSLLEYCQLTAVRIDKMQYVYDHWIKCQHHCNKDQLIKIIVNSIIDNNYHDWSTYKLTLVDEALIQYFLRKQHIEIKCYNLNIFPTNTTKLREYLYHV